MRYFRSIILFWLFIGLAAFCLADQGMWMPHQMKDLNLKALGLAMKPDQLYKKDGTGLMSAVVHLGGGTGEFVSPEGLILTNHHVAFGALQRASTREKDYIQQGFIAWTRNEEIPAKGYIADVLVGYEEVTDQVLSAVRPDMTPIQKYYALDKIKKEMIARAEEQGPDIRAQVACMYSGNQYYLFRFKRIKDIRLVYAPPRDLGNFGGDIDNWMWPRHTCDFSFLRAYVSPDNTGTDYSPENVPYHPKTTLKIALDGFKQGDFTFVMGYPGRTYRNYTLAEVQFDMDMMEDRMENFREIISFYEEAGKEDREVQIKYAGKIKGLNNALKNYQGKTEGMKKLSLVEKKKEQEKEFMEWISQKTGKKERYEGILAKIDAFMEKYDKFYQKQSLFSDLASSYFGAELLSQGYTIYRTAEERQKPDMEREPSFQERNIPYIKQRIELAERSYDLETDKAFLKHQLKKLMEKPPDQIPEALRDLLGKHSEKAVEQYVERLYEDTILADPEKRLELIEKKPQYLLEIDDPFLNLASELEKEMKDLREEEKALSQEREDLKKIYVEALLEKNKGRIAPDANSTIRFTYGLVKGYSPRDAVYYFPQTTLGGVIEKDTGEFPFHVPQKLKEIYRARDFGRYEDQDLNDIPVCFLNTANVTGGNSGSPTLNDRGEQIGIVFDMTYESVTGDYYVVPELQRTISVDIRYVLFITEKFSQAGHIIKELGL